MNTQQETATDASVSEEAVMEMVQRAAGYMIGTAVSIGVQLGDRLGMYENMAGSGPLAADEVADRIGCNRRLIRELLDGQAAAGLVAFDAANDTYELRPEAAMVLADATSPVFLARGIQGISSLAIDMPKIEAAFRGDGGLGWSDHHQCLFDGVEWFFRTGYRAHLAAEWIPAMDGIGAALETGAAWLDVGCGHGASIVALAEAYPNSTFHGVDFHPPSIDVARERAAEAGVADRCSFEVADAKSYDGSYDVISFFDCLHDMGDPVGAAKHARTRLNDAGSIVLVEPFAMDDRSTNVVENPFAAMLYHASAMICTPNSLSQDVGLGLGAQAGEEQLREVFEAAGFTELARRAETPFNLILQAR